MKNIFTLFLLFGVVYCGYSQIPSNIKSTNPLARDIMLGNYDPDDYAPDEIITSPTELVQAIKNGISTDSLQSYLTQMSLYQNRNTGSDTVSSVYGMGAARRWVFSKFEEFSAQNDNRLINSYIQFDQDICGMGQHRNVITVLPGMDTTDSSIVLIEAHLDSRCEDICDVNCLANGMEDNGSGTALVMELARVMGQYSFEHTIVFMATTGEEQGLFGANAFAQYAENEGIAIKAVLNNDIVGGVICGETSSPPSCPGLNDIDSTQVRLFSQGNFNSRNKQLTRFIKLQYEEELLPFESVPMTLTIMSAEDRQGRGGDHIPFRQRGYAAMRFTSANEHGNANVSDPDYHDRQHTTNDVLGIDTDGDMMVDSFYVQFNYLARNAAINATAATMAAIGPETPEVEAGRIGDSILVTIHDPLNYGKYKILHRTTSSNDFEAIYTLEGDTITFIPELPGGDVVSVAAIDEDDVESLFSEESLTPTIVGSEEPQQQPLESEHPIKLLQNRPNPFDESTYISFIVEEEWPYKEAFIVVSSFEGKELKRFEVEVQKGLNEVLYFHGFNAVGTFIYSLVIDGEIIDSKQMIFAN